MPTVNELFLADPEGFMAANIVKMGFDRITGMDEVGGLIYIQVAEVPGAVVENMPGAKVAYTIPSKTSKPDHLPAYWCPYEDNKMGRVTLGNDALFMFTATMNGCSLGAGSYSGKGVRTVAHVNLKGMVNPKAFGVRAAQGGQAKVQKVALTQALGKGVEIVNPADYRTADTTSGVLEGDSTTFGVHALGKNWDFYVLRYRTLGINRYSHDGVSKIIASASSGKVSMLGGHRGK